MLPRTRIFIALLLVATGLEAATYVVPSDRDLVRRADMVVVATALSSYPQSTLRGGIETVTVFSLRDTLKGTAVPGTFEVREPGGVLGDRAQFIPGVPRFVPGEEVLLFLSRTPRGTLAVADLALGNFHFDVDRHGRRLAVRDEDEIVGWDPDGSLHHERARDAAMFLEFIRAEGAGMPRPENYFVAHQPPLFSESVRPAPESAAIAPDIAPYTPISYTFTIGGGGGARWNVFPNSVTFYSNSNGEPGAPGNGVTAVQAAINSWDNDCGSNVTYVYGGTDSTHTTGLSGPDGANTVLFERNLSSYGVGPFQCSGNSYSGVLGIGGVTSTSGQHSFGGSTWFTTIEGDVEMNQGIANCTLLFNNGDFNSAVTHEVGHTLGFRHSDQTRADDPNTPCTSDPSLECSSAAIMKAFIPNGLNAQLQTWDVHAVDAVYPSACGGNVTKRIVDFNGDGKGDVFWHNSVTGQNSIWFMNGATLSAALSVQTVSDVNWKPVLFGDFSGNGKSGVFWRNSSTGETSIWLMDGAAIVSSVRSIPVSDLNWQPVGAGDFNADGRTDIFWRNAATGQTSVWFMNGTAVTAVTGPTVAAPWAPAVFGDFDGDGHADIFWRNTVTGETSVWLMNGASYTAASRLMTVADVNWTPVGAGDFNGDGKSDIFWRNTVTGADSIWLMNGLTASSMAVATSAPTDWSPRVFNNFDGNATGDIFWWRTTTGETSVWLMNGTTFSSATSVLTVTAPNWAPVPSH